MPARQRLRVGTVLMRLSEELSKAVSDILAASVCSVTLPAGSGKTELIAATVFQVSADGGRAHWAINVGSKGETDFRPSGPLP